VKLYTVTLIIKDFSQGCFPIVYRREPGYKIKGEAYKL